MNVIQIGMLVICTFGVLSIAWLFIANSPWYVRWMGDIMVSSYCGKDKSRDLNLIIERALFTLSMHKALDLESLTITRDVDFGIMTVFVAVDVSNVVVTADVPSNSIMLFDSKFNADVNLTTGNIKFSWYEHSSDIQPRSYSITKMFNKDVLRDMQFSTLDRIESICTKDA